MKILFILTNSLISSHEYISRSLVNDLPLVVEHSPGNLQKGGIICYHLMMDVENQLLPEMNGLGQVYCVFIVFSMSDVSLCLGKTYAHPNQRGWMQAMT